MIRESRDLFALVLAPMLAVPIGSTAGELRQNGPWISMERRNDATNRQEQMAGTPAAEDRDVWLVLVCDEPRITASLMHSTAFPPDVLLGHHLVLRSEGFPVVAVPVQIIQKNQLSINPATT